MKMETIIEVQAFGDFDIMYTEAIMISEDKLDLKDLQDEFCRLNDIVSFKGLDYKLLSTITDDFIAFLELKGFTKLKTQKVYFCD